MIFNSANRCLYAYQYILDMKFVRHQMMVIRLAPHPLYKFIFWLFIKDCPNPIRILFRVIIILDSSFLFFLTDLYWYVTAWQGLEPLTLGIRFRGSWVPLSYSAAYTFYLFKYWIVINLLCMQIFLRISQGYLALWINF